MRHFSEVLHRTWQLLEELSKQLIFREVLAQHAFRAWGRGLEMALEIGLEWLQNCRRAFGDPLALGLNTKSSPERDWQQYPVAGVHLGKKMWTLLNAFKTRCPWTSRGDTACSTVATFSFHSGEATSLGYCGQEKDFFTCLHTGNKLLNCLDAGDAKKLLCSSESAVAEFFMSLQFLTAFKEWELEPCATWQTAVPWSFIQSCIILLAFNCVV